MSSSCSNDAITRHSWFCTSFEDYGWSGSDFSKHFEFCFLITLKDKHVQSDINSAVKRHKYRLPRDIVIILLVYITMESPVPQMLWSSNLHQRYSLRKNADWWRHHFSRVIHVYFTDRKLFLETWTKTENVINQLIFVKGLTCESFRLISPLDPKICHGPYFAYISWSINSNNPKK